MQDEPFELTSQQAKTRKRDTSGKPKFKDYGAQRGQHQLFSTNVFELLPQEHDCFLFAELIAQLDTREAEAHYSPIGQRAYDPRQLALFEDGWSHFHHLRDRCGCTFERCQY